MSSRRAPTYKKRFENLARAAQKVTSSLNIGDILEIIRDEAKATIPYAQEACLLITDPDASHYTRPLHCGVYKDRLNCQLCKRGRNSIQKALSHPSELQCAAYEDQDRCNHCRLKQNMIEIHGETANAVSNSSTSTPHSEETGAKLCDIALPIYDRDEPVAVLELIAQEGHQFNEMDVVLLQDLVQLASNAIVNARSHWKMSQEKLTVNHILEHLRPFVPETVQRIVEKNPSAPSLGKRKVDVSILFLDIAGYTRISETLSQEQVNFIVEKYFSSFLDVIYAQDGDINETAGDGLMAIFQESGQENALSASRAALEVRRRTIDINNELKNSFDPIEVNMGINSGIASVGMTQFHGTTGTRMTFTAAGSVTNLAARIAAAASHGDILVGPETAKRIANEMTLYDRGSMSFKNVKEPVQVFSLVRVQ